LVLLLLVVMGVSVWLMLGGGSGIPALAGVSQAAERFGMLAYVRWKASELQPAGPAGAASRVEFDIEPGEPVDAIARRLAEAGLIRNAELFVILAEIRGDDRRLQAGSFRLSPSMSAVEVLQALQRGQSGASKVTIREGLRAEEIAAHLESAGVVGSGPFLAQVARGISPEHEFLLGRPPGASLEGYLFPDTYMLSQGTPAGDVVEAMLDNFDRRTASRMHARADALGLSLHEVVTLASIVEREAALAEERPIIAGVFLNRLAAPPYYLNADPTVQYALGLDAAGRWWRRSLSQADLRSASPYNTYTNPGLPPGPICNPGLAAINAVLEPADTPFHYFVANEVACDGSHVFAATLEEHNRNVTHYQVPGGCRP
jgi:UPF0755 protein